MSEKVVARGPWYGWRVPSLAASACGGGLVLASILALGRLPWAIEGSGKLFADAPLAAASVVVFAVGASYMIARSIFIARAGRVELDDEGIVFQRGFIVKKRVAWSELEAFSDASSGRVDLVKKGEGFARPWLAIPTRDDATRAAVLAALDAHGLRRVEVSLRGRRLVRAAVVGVAAVLVFNGAVYVANHRYRRLKAMSTRKPSVEDSQLKAMSPRKLSVEDSEFLADRVSVQARVRTVIGADDDLSIEIHPELSRGPEFFEPVQHIALYLSSEVEIDGARVPRGTGRCGFGYDIGGGQWSGPASYQTQIRLDPSLHRLTPGHHVLRVISSVSVGGGTCVKTTTIPLEVEPGSLVAQTVKLLPGPSPELTVRPDGISRGEWYLRIHFKRPERALAMRVEILESDTTLARGVIFVPAHAWGDQAIEDSRGYALRVSCRPSGRHVLKARFTPDPKVALSHDTRTTEILGESFEREFVVDVP
jgi:hypothetical protein